MSTAQPGGGAYNDELCAAMASARADVVLLVVVGGNRGSGFSIALDESRHHRERVMDEVPAILRAIADTIEEEQRGAN